MNRNTLQSPMQISYQRRVLFAIEIQNAVNLQTLSKGLSVKAEGLSGSPIVNASGIFVWLEEDIAKLKRIVIDPQSLPFEKAELQPAEIQDRLTTIKLSPTAAYPFSTGVTGLRGTLLEKKIGVIGQLAPVFDAQIQLEWLDEDNHWITGTTQTKTNKSNGSFVTFLRFAPNDSPPIEGGEIQLRLRVERNGLRPRTSDSFKLPVGKVSNPTVSNPMNFAWDDLRI